VNLARLVAVVPVGCLRAGGDCRVTGIVVRDGGRQTGGKTVGVAELGGWAVGGDGWYWRRGLGAVGGG